MDPIYFHSRLTFYEAHLFIKGFERRQRPIMEAARLLHVEIGSLFAKNYKVPKFSWDKDEQKPEYSEDEIEEVRNKLRSSAQEWEKILNRTNNGIT